MWFLLPQNICPWGDAGFPAVRWLRPRFPEIIQIQRSLTKIIGLSDYIMERDPGLAQLS